MTLRVPFICMHACICQEYDRACTQMYASLNKGSAHFNDQSIRLLLPIVNNFQIVSLVSLVTLVYLEILLSQVLFVYFHMGI